MTWLMTICHHMTYVTWREGLKAWLHKHKIWRLTSSVAVRELERWFYFCFARYLGREIHSDYRRLGDLHACIHAWPWKWRSRHGLRWPLLSLLVFVLPRWFFCCFIRISGQEIHYNYRRLRGLHAWPWNWRSRHGLRDMSILPVFVLPQWFYWFCKVFGSGEFIRTIATRMTVMYDLETLAHVMVYLAFAI